MDKTKVRKEEDANLRDNTQNETDQHRGSEEMADDKPFKLQVIRELSSQKGNAKRNCWVVFYCLMSENSREALEESLEVVLRGKIFMSTESIIHFIEENFNLIFLVQIHSLSSPKIVYRLLTIQEDEHGNLEKRTEKERGRHQSSEEARYTSLALGVIKALCQLKISEEDVLWMVNYEPRSENRKRLELVRRSRLFRTKQSMIKFIEENLGRLLEAQISCLCRPPIYYGKLTITDEEKGYVMWDSPEYECTDVLGEEIGSSVLTQVINGETHVYLFGRRLF